MKKYEKATITVIYEKVDIITASDPSNAKEVDWGVDIFEL